MTTTAYFASQDLPVRAVKSEFHAVHLSALQASAMELTTSTPAVKQLRRVYDTTGRCIEAAELVFHPHLLAFEVICEKKHADA